MRLILGDNMMKPSIRDIILIGSLQQDYISNRKVLRMIGRNNYSRIQYRVKYGGKFGDRLINFGKSFYNKVVNPGFNKVIKPVYNVAKKLVDVAANNDFANNAIKIVGNTIGTALGAPGVGNLIASAAKAADSGIKIGESVVNRLIDEKKLDPEDVKQIINIIREQIKEFTGKDKENLENKVENVEQNLPEVDLEKENLTKEDVEEGFKAGLIFYNPVNRKPILKYSGRVKMGGSIKPINPNLLRILPKILKTTKGKRISTKMINQMKDNRRLNDSDLNDKNRRIRMSGNISKNDLNDISSKLEALKSKYK